MAKYGIAALILGILFVVVGNSPLYAQEEKWVVYYSDAIPSEKFLPYDLIVFDSEKHPALRPLQNRNKIILGYLSLGEAEDYRPDFRKIKNLGVLLQENKNWPGHFVIDIRKPEWAKYIIEEKIPGILFQRFDGIMLDTLDSPLAMEKTHPGMRLAAINLLRAIRMHYPDIKIMVNRGFEVLPDAAEEIDMIMAESILVDAFSDKKKPKYFPESVYQELTNDLKAARSVSSALKIYTLDYWEPSDSHGVRNIYQKHRDNGFIPYVATIDLQNIVKEPE